MPRTMEIANCISELLNFNFFVGSMPRPPSGNGPYGRLCCRRRLFYFQQPLIEKKTYLSPWYRFCPHYCDLLYCHRRHHLIVIIIVIIVISGRKDNTWTLAEIGTGNQHGFWFSRRCCGPVCSLNGENPTRMKISCGKKCAEFSR